MSEEEKQSKKQKIEDNRRLRAMSILSASTSSLSIMPSERHVQFSVDSRDDSCSSDSNEYVYSLDDDVRMALTQIEKHYARAVRLNTSVVRGFDSPCLRHLNELVDIVNEPAHISCLRLITFFKLTPEFNVSHCDVIAVDVLTRRSFQSLHEDDRLTLVKHNLFAILFVHFCLCTDITTGIFQEANTTNECCYQASSLRAYSDSVYERTMLLAGEVQDASSNDPLVMKLMILLVIFSKGADVAEPILVESKKAFHSQNVFAELLWHYLNVRFGDERTAPIFSRLIFSCSKAHALAREAKDIAASKNVPNDELAPLMQSVMQIS